MAQFPRLPNLVVDPLPSCRSLPDEDDGADPICRLIVDPFHDSSVTASRDLLPLVTCDGCVAFNATDVSDLRSSPAVQSVVKTEKYASRHSKP